MSADRFQSSKLRALPGFPSSETSELDLSQIHRNLSLSAQERIVEHQRALELVIALARAGEQLRDGSQ